MSPLPDQGCNTLRRTGRACDMAPVPKPSPCAAMDFHSAGRGISGCERMASHVILGSNQIVSEPRPPALKRFVIDPPVSDLVGRG
jgi:hypothetical protein